MFKSKKVLKLYFYCLTKSKNDISNYAFGLKCLLLFTFTIFSYGQSNTKSGNIRSCSVWNYATNLSNATIINGTTVTSNPTSISVNSMVFQNTAALELNAAESVSFGASSSLPCATTEIPADNPHTGSGYVMNGGYQCGGFTSPLNVLPVGTKLTVTVYYTTTRYGLGIPEERVCGGWVNAGCASPGIIRPNIWEFSVFIKDNAGKSYPTQTIGHICSGSTFTFNNIDFVSQSTSRFQVCHKIDVDCSGTSSTGSFTTSMDHSFKVTVGTNDIF